MSSVACAALRMIRQPDASHGAYPRGTTAVYPPVRVCGLDPSNEEHRAGKQRFRFSLLAGLLPMALGCMAPKADVRLHQPAYRGAEQDLHLTTNQVYWSHGAGSDRYLAEFPLPGATGGRPTFLLYLLVPPCPSDGPAAVDQEQPIRGFLIQTQGRNAGLEMIVAGKAAVKGRSMAEGATREVGLELSFEHGTNLTGHLTARRDDWRLQTFETRQRPADVQSLDQPPPAGTGQGPPQGAK
jgi:hypothetical protein